MIALAFCIHPAHIYPRLAAPASAEFRTRFRVSKMVRLEVLYTKQLTKKNKKYEDGFLELLAKVFVLRDERNKEIDRLRITPKTKVDSDTFRVGGYIVQLPDGDKQMGIINAWVVDLCTSGCPREPAAQVLPAVVGGSVPRRRSANEPHIKASARPDALSAALSAVTPLAPPTTLPTERPTALPAVTLTAPQDDPSRTAMEAFVEAISHILLESTPPVFSFLSSVPETSALIRRLLDTDFILEVDRCRVLDAAVSLQSPRLLMLFRSSLFLVAEILLTAFQSLLSYHEALRASLSRPDTPHARDKDLPLFFRATKEVDVYDNVCLVRKVNTQKHIQQRKYLAESLVKSKSGYANIGKEYLAGSRERIDADQWVLQLTELTNLVSLSAGDSVHGTPKKAGVIEAGINMSTGDILVVCVRRAPWRAARRARDASAGTPSDAHLSTQLTGKVFLFAYTQDLHLNKTQTALESGIALTPLSHVDDYLSPKKEPAFAQLSEDEMAEKYGHGVEFLGCASDRVLVIHLKGAINTYNSFVALRTSFADAYALGSERLAGTSDPGGPEGHEAALSSMGESLYGTLFCARLVLHSRLSSCAAKRMCGAVFAAYERVVRDRPRSESALPLADRTRCPLVSSGPSQMRDLHSALMEFFQTELNAEQYEALAGVISALADESSASSAPPLCDTVFYLVRGIFGSGKSKLLASILLAAFTAFAQEGPAPGFRVLIVSLTNAAIDNLLQRLIALFKGLFRRGPTQADGDADRAPMFSDALLRLAAETPISCADAEGKVLRVGSGITDQALQKYGLRGHMGADGISGKFFTFCTCASIERLTRVRDECLEYPLVIIDEATQITEPNILYVMNQIGFRCKLTVMAGDQMQLPPIAGIGSLQTSLFEEMFSSLRSAEHGPQGHARICTATLWQQYRCSGYIADIASTLFYNGLVQNVPKRDAPLLPHLPPVTSINLFSTFDQSSAASRVNVAEADCVADIVELLTRNGLPAREVGIITPYKAQAAAVNDRLGRRSAVADQKRDAKSSCTCATVDSFQGAEKEIILLSLTKADTLDDYAPSAARGSKASDSRVPGYQNQSEEFFNNPNRVNVAITRAKSHLVIVRSHRFSLTEQSRARLRPTNMTGISASDYWTRILIYTYMSDTSFEGWTHFQNYLLSKVDSRTNSSKSLSSYFHTYSPRLTETGMASKAGTHLSDEDDDIVSDSTAKEQRVAEETPVAAPSKKSTTPFKRTRNEGVVLPPAIKVLPPLELKWHSLDDVAIDRFLDNDRRDSIRLFSSNTNSVDPDLLRLLGYSGW